MALNYDRWHEIAKQVSLSRRPFTFWPELDTEAMKESGDYQRELAADLYVASKNIVNEFLAKKEGVERDQRYTEEGRQDVLRQFYEETTVPSLRSCRGEALEQCQAAASERLGAGEAVAFPQPESAFDIALAMKSLDVVRENKWGYSKILEASPTVRNAVALAPADLSGLSNEMHGMIYKEIAVQAGGPLEEAAGFAGEVKATTDAFDYAQVTVEKAMGIQPVAEVVQRSREALAQEREAN